MEKKCSEMHNWECPTNFIHMHTDENGKEYATICWKKTYLDNYLIREFNIELLDLSFKDIDKTTDKDELKFLRHLKRSYDNGVPVGYYLSGYTGIGKTYRTICYCNEMNKKYGKTIAYVFVPSMINLMKQNFDGKNQKNVKLIKNCMEADILVLDDLGAETTNKWWYTNVLLEILNTRAESAKPVIVVSNLSPEQLRKVIVKNMNLDDTETIMLTRILSRLMACCCDMYSWDGKDRRTQWFGKLK